jgi:hypothetical protein
LTESILNLKPAKLSSWLLIEHVDTLNHSVQWAMMAKSDHSFNSFLFSLEDGFDASVAQVFHPTSHVELGCSCSSFMPEKYALNISADKYMSPSPQPLSPTWNVRSIKHES